MNLATAKHYAEKLYGWILPHCEAVRTCATLQVAGSIRRERPVCNDVDLVCIPKVIEERDMLGAVISRTNVLHKFLQDYVANSGGKAKFQSGGDREGKSVILQLPKCQLDIWFATPETFATRLLCRTGSMQHNIWLAERAQRQGKKWTPYEGIEANGGLIRFSSEERIYAELGLPWVGPKKRELDWLVKNFGQ